MRHLGSLLLSIVLGAVAYVLAGIGIFRLLTAFSEQNPQFDPLGAQGVSGGGSVTWSDFGYGLGGLVLAGILLAVIILTPISPVGPLVIGLIYIGAEIWYFEDPKGLTDILGTSILNSHAAAELPLSGLAFVAALSLIATIVIPHRWRGKAKPAVEVGTGSPIPPLYQPSYGEGSEFSAAPQYPTQFEASPTQGFEVPTETTGDTRAE